MNNLIQIIQNCQTKLSSLQEMVPVKQHQLRIDEIDSFVLSPNFWDKPAKAANLMKERNALVDLLKKLSSFKDEVDFYTECITVMPEELPTSSDKILQLETALSELEFKQMLNDPIDDNPAILSINAGAGGLEAANWVTMMLRMYCRYAANHKFATEILDMKPSEEHSSICTDSVSIRVEGPYAYGFLKGEAGVHRLIRNSPFNANDARHTSFAAVAVSPDIEDVIDIKIEEKDLEITAQTAGGPGGQNVNKVASAIRLKHIPSGINILVRTERDQLSNRKTALKMLKSKLYDLELKKKNAEKENQLSQLSSNAFGNQIRTFTLSPYTLIKDHRTEFESNSENVLEGDLHNFIMACLRHKC